MRRLNIPCHKIRMICQKCLMCCNDLSFLKTCNCLISENDKVQSLLDEIVQLHFHVSPARLFWNITTTHLNASCDESYNWHHDFLFFENGTYAEEKVLYFVPRHLRIDCCVFLRLVFLP